MAHRDDVTALIRREKDAPCADCGGRWPFYVMRFDHEGGGEWIPPSGMPTDEIAAELAKCGVVCANCEAERMHSRQAGGPRV